MTHWREIVACAPKAATCIVMFALLVAGCRAVGPDYSVVAPEVPDAWHQELSKGLGSGEANLESWWAILNDPVLDSLVLRAREGNLGIQEAFARVIEARALFGASTGTLLPDIDGVGTYQRTRLSEETNPDLGGLKRTNDFFSSGFDVAWELDVFGGLRRTIEAAQASYVAAIEAYRDAHVVLYAEIASNYIAVRTLQARIELAESNVQIQTETLQLTQNRFDAQLVPQLDVRQAELNLASTESFIPALRILLAESIHRLGVLLGEHPGTLYGELGVEAEIPVVPAEVLVGQPLELLRQRPDVRGSERLLAAQVARIGVATADLYPRFTFVGTFTWDAFDAGDMFDQAARAYSFGPGVRWNLFQGGRIRNAIRAEDARAKQALIDYERTVLLALEEVENSLVSYSLERDRRDALTRAVTAAESSVELVGTLYRTGLTDFQNVLDSQRSLFQQQDQLAESQGQVVQNLIRLYKSLGGGWSGEPADTGEGADGEVEMGAAASGESPGGDVESESQ